MRCKCCDAALVGAVRYKNNEDIHGLYIEEDFCNECIFITDNLEYIDIKSYQFEDITDITKILVAREKEI